MRKLLYIWLLAAAALGARAEIIDRIAVTVDKIVITESDLIRHIRVAAFLDNEPVDLGPGARRAAAQQMVEQVLVRREMEISRYPAPTPDDVKPMLADLLHARSWDQQGLAKSLAKYGISEQDLRESLLMQLTLLRFIEYRFRPGVALNDQEVEAYYKNEFLGRWKERNPGDAPALDDVRDGIEETLIERHVDEALDTWLKQAVARARIKYRKEAFE